MRANIIVAVGVMGEQEDLERFMEIMRVDFQNRCHRAAERLFVGRVTILPAPEFEGEDEAEVQEPS